MASYLDLELNRFYLIIAEEGDPIKLVQPLMETDLCYLLASEDEFDSTYWVKKEAEFFELVDELTDEQAMEYQDLFEDDEEDEEED